MEMTEAVKCLSALAQESRLQVFRLLVRAGPEGVSAGEIAAQLEIPNATLSFHLKELVHSGLISQNRQGRSMIYALQSQALSEFIGYLTEDCCQGQYERCRPTARTPRKQRRSAGNG